ncbi:hypothetical protein BZM26_36155 [Paraburkholderia strydomiana]|nr:hypothetical protein BZM26_36155 [Paraburkholderia strydomiana]
MLLRVENERAIASRETDETHRLLRQPPALSRRYRPDQGVRPESGRSRAVGAAQVASGIAQRSRFGSVHPDDVMRLSATEHPGSQRVRIGAVGVYKAIACVAERSTTHAGDFLVFRAEDPS